MNYKVNIVISILILLTNKSCPIYINLLHFLVIKSNRISVNLELGSDKRLMALRGIGVLVFLLDSSNHAISDLCKKHPNPLIKYQKIFRNRIFEV